MARRSTRRKTRRNKAKELHVYDVKLFMAEPGKKGEHIGTFGPYLTIRAAAADAKTLLRLNLNRGVKGAGPEIIEVGLGKGMPIISGPNRTTPRTHPVPRNLMLEMDGEERYRIHPKMYFGQRDGYPVLYAVIMDHEAGIFKDGEVLKIPKGQPSRMTHALAEKYTPTKANRSHRRNASALSWRQMIARVKPGKTRDTYKDKQLDWRDYKHYVNFTVKGKRSSYPVSTLALANRLVALLKKQTWNGKPATQIRIASRPSKDATILIPVMGPAAYKKATTDAAGRRRGGKLQGVGSPMEMLTKRSKFSGTKAKSKAKKSTKSNPKNRGRGRWL